MIVRGKYLCMLSLSRFLKIVRRKRLSSKNGVLWVEDKPQTSVFCIVIYNGDRSNAFFDEMFYQRNCISLSSA